jgi:H+-transporting ATPase
MQDGDINYKTIDVPELLNELKSDKISGLSESEAKQRLEKYGFNEIPEKEETFLQRVFRRFWGPIPWMIEIAAILSAVVQKWEDFVIITTLLLVNAIIDLWQESKALNVLSVLKQKLAKKAAVLRDGKFTLRDAKEHAAREIIKIKDSSNRRKDQELLIINFRKSYL